MGLLLISFVISFFLVLQFRFAISYFGFNSRQDSRRRWYNGPIPLLGGLSVFASLVLSDLYYTQQISLYIWALVPLLVIGIVDDQRDLSYQVKFVFQFMAIAIWLWSTPVQHIFLTHLGIDTPWVYLLTVFWLLTIMNAFNMTDGMDGLASGVGILLCFFLLILPGQLKHPHLILLLAGALCGFIYWNLKPAKIYLGGTGAHLIGFVLATELLTWTPPVYDTMKIFVPLFLLAFQEIDILMAVVRRAKAGRNIFLGDMHHIYHRLSRAGFGIWSILMIIMSVVAILGFFTVLIAGHQKPDGQIWVSVSMTGLFLYLLHLVLQMEAYRKDYFDEYLKVLVLNQLDALDIIEVSSEDSMVVYSFSDFREELLRMSNEDWQKWLQQAIYFIKTEHSSQSLIFMSSDGDLLILDPKINGALKFHNFHQKFHDVLAAKSPINFYWPLLLLKYMPIVEVGRLPGNIEVTITEEAVSTKVA